MIARCIPRLLFACSIMVFAACKDIAVKVKTEEADCKICLEKTAGFGEHYGDVTIKTTAGGNFLKFRCTGNNKIMFSAGRDTIEYYLDTIECRYLNNAPDIVYEDKALLVISQNCGTNCWVNTFIYPNCRRSPAYGTACFIDTNYYRFVTLGEEQNNLYFNIQDLTDSNLSWVVKSNYDKHSPGGVPSMHISNVYLIGDTVYYSIDSNGKVIHDSVCRQ